MQRSTRSCGQWIVLRKLQKADSLDIFMSLQRLSPASNNFLSARDLHTSLCARFAVEGRTPFLVPMNPAVTCRDSSEQELVWPLEEVSGPSACERPDGIVFTVGSKCVRSAVETVAVFTLPAGRFSSHRFALTCQRRLAARCGSAPQPLRGETERQ